MRSVYSSISNLVKRAVVTLTNKDSGQFASTQVKWMKNKVATIEVVHPYGLSSNAPVNSLALVFNVMGQEENRAGIVYNPQNRFKELKEGEVALGNFVTKSVIKFLENGDIEITGKNDQIIKVTGNSNITVGGSTTLNSTGNVDITSPVVTVDGDLRVTGEVTAFYALGTEISFSDIRTKYNVHFHTAQGATADTTDPNNNL